MSSKYDKELLEAKKELEKIRSDPATRDLYFDREMALMDFISGMEGSREEGFEEGMSRGKEEGKAEGEAIGKREMIKAMLKKGLAIEIIAEISKLNIEEIEKIEKES